MTSDESPEAPQTPSDEPPVTTTPEEGVKPSGKPRAPRKPKLEEHAINAANRWIRYMGYSQRTHDYRKLARLLQDEQPKTVGQVVRLVHKAKKEKK